MISDATNYKIGDKITDYGCQKTNKKCGTNLVFKTASKIFLNEYALPFYKCIQRCSCINSKFIANDGECSDSLSKTEIN